MSRTKTTTAKKTAAPVIQCNYRVGSKRYKAYQLLTKNEPMSPTQMVRKLRLQGVVIEKSEAGIVRKQYFANTGRVATAIAGIRDNNVKLSVTQRFIAAGRKIGNRALAKRLCNLI